MKYSFLCLIILMAVFSCAENDKEESISKGGVWLTNVASDALDSRENIKAVVEKCYDLGISTIYCVTWNKNMTMFRSTVAEKVTGFSIDPKYGERDPLREVIQEAHARGIKVVGWFEFGFASSINDETGGILIQKNPEWASRDAEGNITEKNNFYWLNAFHPEVQNFITDLVVEAVSNYDLDGIQGDDRLPALPSNGGYDRFTSDLYESETGRRPPADHMEDSWLSWRADKLSDFLEKMVTSVRIADPDIIISMAPSIFPWSKENYLQDWPKWLERGLVDEIIPQVYRYNAAAYSREVDKIVDGQILLQDQDKLQIGVLLQVNDFVASEALLDSFILHNRSRGINKETYFFYEGVKKREAFFSKHYRE